MGFLRVLLVMLVLLNSILGGAHRLHKVFNVIQYGAVADGKTDNAKAFEKAWEEACKWREKAMVLIPEGTFMISKVLFKGPCNGPINFRLRGVLKALPDLLSHPKWIGFRYIDRLVVGGRGAIDAQGSFAWTRNFCSVNTNCQTLPLSMGFDFVTNSRIHRIKSINSKNTHINVFACDNLNISRIKILAPDHSPNTDGIRIGESTRIKISQSEIGTGDDCIAMLPGSKDILVSEVVCGPGRGISVGSLGKYRNEKNVKGIRVERSTFVGTDNGVRIKTWANSAIDNVASHFVFENIHMKNVSNPIIVDQEYCPYPPCAEEGHIQVKITDITFKNIWGTSRSKNAVLLRCSPRVPCRNIKLHDINLSYINNEEGSATSLCANADGEASGHQNPRPCI
ncbi:exopolygalacturonase-like [Malania oleifera]|uniref:exopolygalacturonase-like n=1 Tax=Malania oleifera TaxID=397392 RepID=UPI0025ADC328|nr:exopolygalacturonase-like [Malania oleifera]